jgi:major membrane immunogen (membrane-anchored lipoprotein)
MHLHSSLALLALLAPCSSKDFFGINQAPPTMEMSILTIKDGTLGMKEKVPQDRVFALLD